MYCMPCSVRYDNMIVIVAVVIIIIIIYLVFHNFLDCKSSILSCIR